MLGKIEGRRRRGRQRMRWLDGITDSMDWVWVNSRRWWWTGRPGVLQSTGSQSQTRLSDWTELNWIILSDIFLRVAQLCPTLCDLMDYTVHGILQARILKWVSPSLLQSIFGIQRSNPGLPHWRRILYHLSHQGSQDPSRTILLNYSISN